MNSRNSLFPYPGVTLTHWPDRPNDHHYHSPSAERSKHLRLLYGNHEQTQRHERHAQNDEPIAVRLVLCHGKTYKSSSGLLSSQRNVCSFMNVSRQRWRTGVSDRTQGQWRTKIRIIEPVMGLSRVTFPQVKVALAWAILLRSFPGMLAS